MRRAPPIHSTRASPVSPEPRSRSARVTAASGSARERIVVIGDVMNDLVTSPRGPLRPDTDQAATIRPRPGGSAANTAVWLAAAGAEVDFIGAVGEADADLHERSFRDARVTAHLHRELGLPTGTVVLMIEGARRSMLTDRGANKLLQPEAVTDALLASAAHLHMSAYCFLDGFGVRGARSIVDRAVAAGVPVSVNPGSIGYLLDFGVDRFAEATRDVSIVFPNLAEIEAITGISSPERAVAALLERHETVVLSLGPDGAYAATRGGRAVRVAAPRARVVDPTGAGDAFCAGFLERWLRDRDLEAATTAAVMLAARAIVVVGGRPF
jgi:sugar/nucleoside kinase (ribokinase family)